MSDFCAAASTLSASVNGCDLMTIKKETIYRNKWNLLAYAAIFAWMLACNMLTPFLVDDFNYMYSFATGERIRSVLDIFPSMAAHAQEINGRLTAHFLVQLTLLFPGWCFDIANAAIFTALVWMMERISRQKDELSNPWMILACFAGIWFFQLGFGNVNLWQDGSVNYLWSYFFGFLYLWPFARRFLYGDCGLRRAAMPFYLILSLAAGAFTEGASVAVIAVTGCLLLLQWFMEKKRPAAWQFGALVLACAGQISIYLAPAQWLKKAPGKGLYGFLYNILRSCGKCWDIRGLIFLFGALLIIAWMIKVDWKRILFSVCLFIGAMAANFMMVFAISYPERAVGCVVVLMVTADIVLLRDLLKNAQWRSFAVCILMIAALALPPRLAVGGLDIYRTYAQDKTNIQHILEQKAAGKEKVSIRFITIDTPYSGAADLRYVADDPTIWPNNAMAKYYGVDSIFCE